MTSHPSRRAFAAACLAMPLASVAAEPQVIDAATHFYDTSRPQGVPWPPPNESVLYKRTLPERYLAAIKPHSVSGVVAIEASPWLEDNLWLLNLGDRTPLIRAVVGNIPPGHPDFRPALDRFSKHPLWRGIRINVAGISKAPADLRHLMEKGQSLDILVSQPDYQEIAKLAESLPDLRIVVGHLPLDDSKGIRACAAHPNLFAKVSGVVRKDGGHAAKELLDELWDVFGPDRLLYASNWPTCDMIAPYRTVFQVIAEYLSRRTSDDRDKFFLRNAQSAYRLT